MAAYAALVSLMNTMNNIQIHPRVSTFFNKNQLESLGGTVVFLLDFIESYSYGGRSGELEDLEAELARAAHAAEDVIESHIVDLIHAGQTEKKGGLLQKMMRHIKRTSMKLHKPRVIRNLQKVTKDMDSIKKKATKVEKQGRFKNQTQQAVAASSRPVSVSAGKTATMVGFDDYLIHLLDKLTGLPSHQQVIPIIGMGGIGKTTLARNAFESPLIKHHFDVRAWATISQNYRVREILLQLLSSREGSDSLDEQQLGEQDQEDSTKFVDLNEQELGEKLYKFLFNRRYLIILDDIWGIEVWDEIKFSFPDNNNGSRIVLTTRLLDISRHFNSPYLTINLLDKDKSWNLFCQESFGDESCPVELEEVGKKICENCKGLPLSIFVIGGFLRKSCKSREYWDGIARDTYSILSSEGDNQCMNILSLSYNHLPAHLQPCFLYMGVFEEDEVISVSRLIKLWVAEGLLRPNDGQSLEEVGEGYLKDLVDRNLILDKSWGISGKIKDCHIHDLIRELCLSVAEKEKFLCVMNSVGTPRAIHRERRIVIHESMSNHDLGSESLVRSLICKCHARFNFRLLRVLTVVGGIFLLDDFNSVNLRCLDRPEIGYQSHPFQHIPKKISLLWNLQTVRIMGYYDRITAPSELWDMVQLRHVQVDRLYVPDPPRNGRVDLVLQNLQTLRNALNFRLSEEVCKRIPNVKKLHLVYSESTWRCKASSYYCPQNLGRFHMLESLTLRFEVESWRRMVLRMTFPNSLKKLSLICVDLHWKDLEMIGSLPNLEVFKLWAINMIGSEWNPVEGEFRSLKFLQIWGSDRLTKLNAESFHFPVLEILFLKFIRGLDEIPSGIGEIPTLRIISLYSCNVHCALSAVKILEEQESLGNDDLQVIVRFGFFFPSEEKDRFRKMMEEEGFTSNNLHIENI